MTTYLLGLWTPDLLNLSYMPIGVVVRKKDTVAARLAGESRLPEEYRPRDELAQDMWKEIGDIFKDRTDYSTNPTNLYFTKHNLELQGSLEEKADKFFEKFVVPYLK